MSTLQRTRSFSWDDPATLAATARPLSGVEFIAGIADRTLPSPPFARMLDLEITEVQPGRVVFAMKPAEWMYNPMGVVHGGLAATILDSCMGCAVHTTLDVGFAFTTADLQVRYIRPMTAATGRVLAEGHVVHRGRRVATAEGRLLVESGQTLLAHATTGCIILAPTPNAREDVNGVAKID